MNKLKLTVLFLFLIFGAFAQKQTNCRKCKTQIKALHLKKYTKSQAQMTIVRENWSESFFNNLENKLKDRSSENLNIVNLRFDALGCLYPDITPSKKLSDKFSNILKRKGVNGFDGQSLYILSENTIPKTAKLFWDEYLKIEKIKVINPDSMKLLKEYNSQYAFSRMWNNYFINSKADSIKNIIYEKQINKIVVLAHGYNVPYSLGQIQFENIIEAYKEKVDCSHILFFNIFWPSSAKKSITKEMEFFFKNNLSLNVIADFKKVVPRTYLVALGLRKMLNQVNFNGNYDFMSHSLGANVVTATLIDPIIKNKNSYIPSTLRKLRIQEFQNTPLKINPKSINVFMNAPAIGGQTTFVDLDANNPIHKLTKWVIGYNTKDQVLKRPFFRIFYRADNTKLGCNCKNDAVLTKNIFRLKGLQQNYKYEVSGIQRDLLGHDFFCYFVQNSFKTIFNNFINSQNFENEPIAAKIH